MKPCPTALILAVALGLAACKGENKGTDERTAVGEILPGSASDAMLPYDSLRSQPPLAPQTGSAETGKGKGSKTEDEPDAAATDSDTPPVPPVPPVPAESAAAEPAAE